MASTEYNKKYYTKYGERQKIYVRERYRSKESERESLLNSIAGRPRPDECELCKRHGSGASKRLKTVFDHDHKTGQFRGWLCNKCNWILGLVGDDPSLLDQLSNYLRSGGIGYGPSSKEVNGVVEQIENQNLNDSNKRI